MLATALSTQRSARAQSPSPRVVTLDVDHELEHAIGVALTSWRVDVVPAHDPPPGRDLDDAVRTGHRIARAAHARIVVWLTEGSMWIYDDGTRGVVVRPLPSPPPFDEATAAAIALTLKSVLHAALEHPAQPLELERDEESTTAPAKTVRGTHTVRIATFGGARVPTNASDALAARFGAELTYFPSWFRQKLGLAITGEAGPSVLVDHAPYFVGTATDTLASVSLRWRIPLRTWLALEIGAGPGIHFTALEGSSQTLGLAGRITRTDPSLETTFSMELAWKFLRVAPMLGSSFRAHYERYQASGVYIYTIPPGQMFYALRVGVEVP